MEYNIKEIKKGIKIHNIKTELFKTDLITILLTTKLNRENITANALIPAVLRRGSQNMPTQEEISKNMEEMYGATFDCGIDKIGDNIILKFYIESINNRYLLDEENLLKESIEKLIEIVLNPLTENNQFKPEYVETEKENAKQLINSKIDSKDQYAFDQCISTMYDGQPYGLYKYGYIEDIEQITPNNLYEQYKQIKEKAKIDIFLSGNFDEVEAENIIKNNQLIKALAEREPEYYINNEENEKKEEPKQEKIKQESLEVAQGKLAIGLDILTNQKEARYAISIYNVILGGSANSKLFQNVREKESLAYSIGSIYIKQKNTIIVKAGIEIENYTKALELIKEQIEAMKRGEFTEEDLEKAKKYMIYGIKAIIDEQDTGITYYIGQELAGTNVSPEEYIQKINHVTKQNIQEIAQKVKINTIYFLKN